MDWYKNQNANNSALVPGADPFKVNDMFNKPLHKSIGNPTGFSLQDNPLSKSLASGKTDFLGGLKNINGGIGDFAKGAGLSTGSLIDMGAGIVDSVAGAAGLKGAEVTTGMDTAIDTLASLPLEFIPGFGTIAKGGLKALSLVNKYAGKSSNEQGTGFDMGVMGYGLDINENAGKKYGLFSRKSRKRTNILTDRYDKENLSKYASSQFQKQNSLASQNTTASLADKNYQQMMGGYNTQILSAKLGTKISPVNLRNIVNKASWNVNKKNRELESKEEVETSKNKVLTETDKGEIIEEVTEEKTNVIPEGAFHSRKNNMHEDVAEHVTKKGIPVITKDEEGKVTQHAEVERNEIIFHKEATDTMETLYKKYNEAKTQKLKDEIAIECGKYIADQILVNTDDRTGIIDTIE